MQIYGESVLGSLSEEICGIRDASVCWEIYEFVYESDVYVLDMRYT